MTPQGNFTVAVLAQLAEIGSSAAHFVCGHVRQTRSSLRHVAAPALLGLLAACSSAAGPAAIGGYGGNAEVMMPPDEYIRPFQGKVTVMSLPHEAGSPLLSLSHHAPGQCAIWLPHVGDPGITPALYQCLAVIEVANCNGATDINTPAVKARAAFGEQAKYSRLCSQGHWDWAFNTIREPAMTSQVANAGSAPAPQF